VRFGVFNAVKIISGRVLLGYDTVVSFVVTNILEEPGVSIFTPTLMMEAAYSSETFITTYKTIQLHCPEYS
jgi:hypothetical protein